jgi:hypothetical protein
MMLFAKICCVRTSYFTLQKQQVSISGYKLTTCKYVITLSQTNLITMSEL